MDVRLAYQANCWGPLGGNAVGVTSIGQLTYLTFGDMGRAIASNRSAGYQGVELFDGNILDYPGGAKALASALSAAGVKLVAAYSGVNFAIFPRHPQSGARPRRPRRRRRPAGELSAEPSGDRRRG